MHLLNNMLSHYSWQGLTLIGVLLILFFVQMYYYSIAYGRIRRFRLMRTHKRRCENPAVSVIVVVRGENELFLTVDLPSLLSQHYNLYEVVVVYVGGDIDYYDELQRVRKNHSWMRLTKMGGNERLYITTKQAMNVGIKSAQYDNLLFTTTGASPRSEEWVATMARGFERGSIVIAPVVPLFEEHSLKTYLMRMCEFHRQRNAFAQAVTGYAYWAPRSNFGFVRKLYDSTRGFNHLNLDIGENDLYLQSITTPRRTAVVMSKQSIMTEERSSDWHEWLDIMRYYNHTESLYPNRPRTFHRWETCSRVLFFLAALAALILLPHELRIGVALLVLIRYIVVLVSTRRTARKLGEVNIAWRYWIYDLVGPMIDYMISLGKSHKSPSAWR